MTESVNIYNLKILEENCKKSEKNFSQLFYDIYKDILDKTSFLDVDDQNWNMRKYCYKNNITEYPKCIVCGEKCKINHKTCCKECTKIYCKSEECINKKIQKTKELHGDKCYTRKLDSFEILKKNNIDLYNDVFDKTKWLDINTTYSERMYCYKNKINEYPKCEVCGNRTKFIRGHGYTKTCCNECSCVYNSRSHLNISDDKKSDIRERTSQTRLNFSEEKKKDIRERTERTNLEKYGYKSPAQNKDIQIKMKQTCLEKHGIDNIFRDKEYIKECVKNKYGVDNIFKRTDIIQRKIKEKYGVDNTNYINMSKECVDILNNEEKFKNMIFENKLKSVKDIMSYLNISDFCVLQHLRKYNIQGLINRNVSHYEDELSDWLKSYNIRVINNSRLLDKKEIDIFLPDYKIGIEFDGSYWHSDIYREPKYHQNKSLLAIENNIFLYHIFEYEWNDIEKLKLHLLNILGLNKEKIYARKCTIKEIAPKEKDEFLNNNHLQGSDKSNIKLGLFYNEQLVEVMTFCKPRFNRKYEYELSRLCTLKNYNVVGGASRLFKYFINNYKPKNIISYSNFAKNRGNIYSTLGFNKLYVSNPNYVWVKNDIVLTRYQTQKSKLLEKGFNGNTEDSIMRDNGFLKIYDCGNYVYEWINKLLS